MIDGTRLKPLITYLLMDYYLIVMVCRKNEYWLILINYYYFLAILIYSPLIILTIILLLTMGNQLCPASGEGIESNSGQYITNDQKN